MRTRTKLHISGVGFKIGDLVKDELTGFEGIVTCHSRHITGCDTVWLTSQTAKNPEAKDPMERNFDVNRIKLIESNPLNIQGFPEDVEPAGG